MGGRGLELKGKTFLPEGWGSSCGFGQDLEGGHPQSTGQEELGWGQRLGFRGGGWIHYSYGSHTCLWIRSFSLWLLEEVIPHSP